MAMFGAPCGNNTDPNRIIPNKPWDDRCCCPGIKCCVPLNIIISSNGWVGTTVGDLVGPADQLQKVYGYNDITGEYFETDFTASAFDVVGSIDTADGWVAEGASSHWWPRIYTNQQLDCSGESKCYPPPSACEGITVTDYWCETLPNMCSPPPTNPNYTIPLLEYDFDLNVVPPKCWHRFLGDNRLIFDEDRNTTVQAFKDRGRRYPEVDYTISRQRQVSSKAKDAVILYETFPKRWVVIFNNDENGNPVAIMKMISDDLNNDNAPDNGNLGGNYLGVQGLDYETSFVIDQKCGPRNFPDTSLEYPESLWCEADTNVAKPKLAPFIDPNSSGTGCVLSIDLKPNLFTKIHKTLLGELGTAGVKGNDCDVDIPLYCHDDVTYDNDGQPLFVTNYGASDGIPYDHGTKYIWPNGWKVNSINIVMPGSGYAVGEYIKFKYFENPSRGGEAIMRPICRGNNQTLAVGGPVCEFLPFGIECCDTIYDEDLGIEHAASWEDDDGYTGEEIDTAIHKVFYQRAKITEVDENGGIKNINILPLTRTQYESIGDMYAGIDMPKSKKKKYSVSYGRILCHSKSIFDGGTEYSEGDIIEWHCKSPPSGLVKDQKTNLWYNINIDDTNACVEADKAYGVVVDVDEYGSIQEWFIRGSDAWISNSVYNDGPEITIGQKINAYIDTNGDTPCGLMLYTCEEQEGLKIGFLCQSTVDPISSGDSTICPEGYTLIETTSGNICRKITNTYSYYNDCLESCSGVIGDNECVKSLINTTFNRCVASIDANAYDNILNINGDINDKRGRYHRDAYNLCEMRWLGNFPIRTATYGPQFNDNVITPAECYGTESVEAQIYEHSASLSVNAGLAKWPFEKILHADYTDIASEKNRNLDQNTLLATLFPLYPKNGDDYVLPQLEVSENGILEGGNDSDIGGSITNITVALSGAGFAYLETRHIAPDLPNTLPPPSGGGTAAEVTTYSFIEHNNYPLPNRNYWTAPDFVERIDKYSWFEVSNIVLGSNKGTGYIVDEIYEIYPEEAVPNSLQLSTEDHCPNGTYYEGIYNRADFTPQGYFNWTINGYKYVETPIPGTTSTRSVKVFTPGRSSKCKIKITEVDINGAILNFEILPEIDPEGNIRTYENGSIIRQGGVMYKTISAGYKRPHPDFYCYIGSSTGYGAVLFANIDTSLDGDGSIISVDIIASEDMIDPKNPPNIMPIGGRDYTRGDIGVLWEFDGNFGQGQLLAHWCKDYEILWSNREKADWVLINGSLPTYVPMSTLMSTSGCPNDSTGSSDLLNKTYQLYYSVGSVDFPRMPIGGNIRYDIPNYVDLCAEYEVIWESDCYANQGIEGFGFGYICPPQSHFTLRSRERKPFYSNELDMTFYYYLYSTVVIGMNMVVQSTRDCTPTIEYNAGVP